MSQKILVIIPTFNESENISQIIASVFFYVPNCHILIVDDNSPDGTSEIVKNIIDKEETRLHIINREKKQGLGPAYIDGFKWAINNKYDLIFEMDADFSHDPISLTRMIEILNGNADVVVGSRYKEGINVVNWPLGRILLSYAASFYVRIITGMPIKDPTAGYVGYKKEVLKNIELDKIQFIGYAFQIEMKYKSWIKGYNIKEFPIIFKNRINGKSKMDQTIFWEAIIGVIKMKFLK
tara:strand:+ start:1127 stop:1837 length:711 start_codon:yes stop_codon:yes gene_type:complete